MVGRDSDVLGGLTRKEDKYFRSGHRMAERFPKGARLFSKANRVLFRLSGGRVGSRVLGVPVGLLTTTGRRSGRPRTVPVVILDEGSRFLVASSNSGLDSAPAWYLNLRASPNAAMRTRAGTVRVIARELKGSERAEAWVRLEEHNRLLGAYQSCTRRQIAVFALDRLRER
jgi:deazaflavin-dependent oxidoreductase (nitroreductase family)